ncbi:RHS repeat domain-containing protein [Apibacter adventoris]|uniref:hypothetical protein n=1 Tax=Apibacter adventoris TaxID=1679466 RepID=UPI000CF65E5F|nr:hypothetical protein [Apibacter adventoris]PQL94520.1 hypothetical protein C4S76_05120 [Apibacter adventoris]
MKIIIQTNNIYRIKLLPVFTSLFLLFSLQGKGQYYANVPTYPKTPEAASLSKFGDIPVGYYTGIPNIEIPLYTIEQDGIKIPITMRYHSSGIKVDEIASRVGIGWSLDTGGNITRKVYGSDDKDYTPKLPLNFKPDGSSMGQESPESFNIAMQAIGELREALGYSIVKDLQPDVYSYSFLGESGRFIFNTDKSINKINYSNLNISSENYNQQISIVNTSGIKAIYSVKNMYMPILLEPTIYNNSFIQNLWTLDKIETPKKEEILYKYKDSFFIYDMFNAISEQEVVGIYRKYEEINGPPAKYNPPPYDYYAQKVYEKPLNKIIFNQGYIEFIYDTKEREDLHGDHSLKEVKVFNNKNMLIKHYQFSYSYFSSIKESIPANAPYFLKDIYMMNSLSKRLKLTSIKEILSNSKYSFEYNEEHLLPPRLSPNKDHWGLANGTSNSSYLPEMKWFPKIRTIYGIKNLVAKKVGSANREPNFDYAKLGTLKTITYPTGGKTEFTYELDDYYFEGEEIEEETYQSRNIYNNKTKDTFTLTPNDWNAELIFNNGKSPKIVEQEGIGKSYGVLEDEKGKKIISLWQNRNLSFNELVDLNLLQEDYNQNKTYRIKVYPEENIHLIGNWKEPSVFMSISWINTSYKQVKKNKSVGSLRIKEIKNYDTTGELITYKKYDYTHPNTGFSSAKKLELDPYYMAVVHSYATNNSPSMPLGLTDFFVLQNSSINELNIEGNKPVGYEYVTEKTVSPLASYLNQYKFYVEQNIYHPDNKYAILRLPENIGIFFNFGTLLKETKFNEQNRLLYKKESEYTNSFYGNFPNNLTIGVPIMIFSNENTWIGSPSGPQNIDKHYKFEFSRYTINSHWNKLLKEQTTEYFYQGHQADSLTTVKNYTYSSDYNHIQPVQTQITTSTGGELITNYQYPPDINENPLMQELTSQNRISTPVTTEVLRKEDGSEKQISFTETRYAQDATTSNLILPKYIYNKKGEAILEKKITYDKYDNKGNLLQYTLESGIPVSIIWGYNQQHPIAKIEGTSYSEIESYVINLQNLSNNSDEQGLLSAYTSLRNKLPLAMITTYTYLPLIGVSTITPPNGLTEYYTYDDAGRLKEIKNQDGQLLKSFEYHYKSQN